MNNYLSSARFRQSAKGNESVFEAAISDRGRVLFSAPFRRLQEKAQVFSLEDDAAVRTRLTHSLEVAHIGMHLMREILRKGAGKFFNHGETKEDGKEAAILFVETACLLHDIGNPPFGHFGERVIRHWFLERKEEFLENLNLSNKGTKKFLKFYKDFELFDGNPQGFRIVSKLQWNHDENGLNLTATQLASLLKYTGTSSDTDHPKKKFGCFQVDFNKLSAVWALLGMEEGQRHVLSYVMEASDDMAYCLSDIEDGIEKGIISMADVLSGSDKPRELEDLLKSICKGKNPGKDRLEDLQMFLKIKTQVTNILYDRLSDAFIKEKDSFFEGFCDPLIKVDEESRLLLSFFRNVSETHLYNSRLVKENEIKANKILRGVLDAFLPLLKCSRERFDAVMRGEHRDRQGSDISIEHALFLQLGKKFVQVYINDRNENDDPVYEWIVRAHMVVDQLSGMTDKYALAQFKLLKA